MNIRILPKISSGKLNLMVSETLCFNPLDGLKINLPTSDQITGLPGKDIIFNFEFKYENEVTTREIKTTIVNE